MKIGIDASCILPRQTGIGVFTRNLLREMLSLETPHDFSIFLNSLRHQTEGNPFPDARRTRLRKFRIPGPLLVKSWRRLHFPPIEVFTGFVNLFHSMTGYIPPQLSGKRVATVYDLYFMRHPENCDPMGGRFFAETFPRVLPKCDHIICPSNSTRRDLIQTFGIAEDKITVVYGGVDHDVYRPIVDADLLERIRQEYCLPSTYILSVCTLEPRKNIEGLLIAYRRLKEIIFNPPKLVLAGSEGWDSESIRMTVREHQLTSDVFFPGYISENHLPMIYNSALLFAFPSFFEGFGLPVLEAMACGIPCLTSNAECLVEIAGDAAMQADPSNYIQMAERLKDLITSHRIREDYRRRGLDRVRNYSWKLSAEKTLRVYNKVLGV